MGKLIFEVRQKMVRGGIELQAISKSNRGTKYISDSIVVLHEAGQKYPSRQQIMAAIEELTGRPS
jgi:hypothetical protein